MGNEAITWSTELKKQVFPTFKRVYWNGACGFVALALGSETGLYCGPVGASCVFATFAELVVGFGGRREVLAGSSSGLNGSCAFKLPRAGKRWSALSTHCQPPGGAGY